MNFKQRGRSLLEKRVIRWPIRLFASFAAFAIPALYAAQAAELGETTQSKFQTTYVWQRKPAFPAAYSGSNSLSPEAEKSYSLSATIFLGTRIWSGGELYFNPEMIMSQSLSNLTGLGGLTNGEDQKGGGSNPTLYLARLFFRQTLGFGGGTEAIDSAPNQLGGEDDKRRLVLTVGKLSLIDIFDNNSLAHDPRTQFLNWSLLDYGAFDFAADQRGYSVGTAIEYYDDDWTLRVGRFEQPIESNGLSLDSRPFVHYGDQAEVEHAHEIAGQPGRLRLLVFRNRARMGGFQDALNFWDSHGRVGVPDVGNVRKDQSKAGIGFSLEQSITRDIGLFARASRNDGGEEVYAFAEIDQSLTGGIVAKGRAWGRAADTVGVAYAQNGLSSAHRQYLASGGLGFFIGDGNINYRPERILESYYSLGVAKNTWLSLDYQRIENPAYNADRGPVRIVGARLHLDY
ncbi:carbohydrate-selective porin, OprB family [mine drainage metagenome]|uniref:Carbohydrate-selective porin, OprB family n=1 Tax=mine drainage metagenome TaxID=410659 RepID=A0A1J5T3T1_9ZZZZ